MKKLNILKKNRQQACARAIASAVRFLSAASKAQNLYIEQGKELARLAEKLRCPPLQNPLPVELSVQATICDPYGKNTDDSWTARFSTFDGVLKFFIIGQFRGDVYANTAFSVDLNSLKTKGQFSDLVSWESFSAIVANSNHANIAVDYVDDWIC